MVIDSRRILKICIVYEEGIVKSFTILVAFYD